MREREREREKNEKKRRGREFTPSPRRLMRRNVPV